MEEIKLTVIIAKHGFKPPWKWKYATNDPGFHKFIEDQINRQSDRLKEIETSFCENKVIFYSIIRTQILYLVYAGVCKTKREECTPLNKLLVEVIKDVRRQYGLHIPIICLLHRNHFVFREIENAAEKVKVYEFEMNQIKHNKHK